MSSKKYSSEILEVPIQLLPENERTLVEAKYARKGSVFNFFDKSLHKEQEVFYRRCSDIFAMSGALGLDPTDISINISPKNGNPSFDHSRFCSSGNRSNQKLMHANSVSCTLHNSLDSENSLQNSHATTSRKNMMKNMHSKMSFDIDMPTSLKMTSRLTGRRSSKSLEFSTLQYAEETRQETIPEIVMEHFDCPSPCKAYPVVANGDVEMSGSSVASTVFVSNKSSLPLRNQQRTKKHWPSIKTRFGRFNSVKKNDNVQHSFPLIHPSLIGHGKHPKFLSNIDSDIEDDIVIDEEVKRGPKTDTNDEVGSVDKDEQAANDISTKTRASNYLKEQFTAFFQPSDNKLALKLFGNKNAVNKEKQRQQQQGKWVIHPCSNFRFYWDLMMLVLLITNLIVLPVAISFFNDDLSIHWIVFNCFSDTFFILDIAVNFRTGIITNDFADDIILDPKIIARKYMRSWFIMDLLSSIPMDYLFLVLNHGQDNKENYSQFLHAGRTLRIFRLAKLLSMLRLLRLSRLVRYVSQWEEFLNMASKFIGICKLVLLMLLLGHWNACLQFLIPMLMEYPAESWVIKCNLKDAYWFKQYTWSLFKAMSHMLSIGYGRFPPTSISEAWITIVSMMTGSTCYALFVGHAAAIIQSFDTSKRLYREKFKQVEEYMAYRKLPRALRQRIANYYEHRYQGKMFDEEIILEELSECLREQIINYNCRALVAAVPFFTYADQDFVSEVVTKLRFEVYQPGDLIIKEGTIGTKMFFIQEGIVDIITKDGEVATSLSDGSYFGEICLLTNAKRVASVRAETYCNLYSLDAEHFQAVLENYPLMRRTMESVAAERLSKIGQNPQLVSSRENLREDLNLVKEIVSSVSPMPSDDESSDNDSDGVANSSNKNPSNLNYKKSKKPRKDSSSKFSRRKSAFKQGIQNVLKLTTSKSNLSFSSAGFNSGKRKSKTLSSSKKGETNNMMEKPIDEIDKRKSMFPSVSGAYENQLQILITPSPTQDNTTTVYSISDKESCV